MQSGKTVLVTGGAGYIGSHVVLALREAGFRPVVVDDLSTGRRALVPSDVPFVEGNVGDLALVRRVLRDEKVEVVLHFAGSIVVPESVADPLKYYRNNTATSRTLIEACVTEGVERFIFSSTAAVYGNPEQVPVTETTPPAPINPYGTSKLMTETMLRDVAAATKLRYVALRYFNVAGADPEGRTGQATPEATHLLKVACEVATGKRNKMSIFGTDYGTKDGTCVRDYIHVSDLAAAHVSALRHLVDGGASLTMNCGYGHGFSVREVLHTVEEVAGRKLPIEEGPRRPGDSETIVADSTLLRRTLDWTPRHDDLRFIVETALRWEEKFKA